MRNIKTENIVHGESLLAIIIYNDYVEEGVHFFTPPNLSQQIGYMNHTAGTIIGAHIHNPVSREVHYTQEVLIIKKGKLRVDFYDMEKAYLKSRMLESGDVILLASGGHGFEVIEDLEMIEVKQGPHIGEEDKTRFKGIDSELATFEDL